MGEANPPRVEKPSHSFKGLIWGRNSINAQPEGQSHETRTVFSEIEKYK
jgi:hypothetical protein